MWFSVASSWCQSFGDISPYVCSLYFLVRFELLSDHYLGNSCPLGWPFVLNVFCLFVTLVISHFGFESGICLLIATVPVHCFLITFIILYFQKL